MRKSPIMKHAILSTGMILFSIFVYAQAYEGKIDYDKKKQVAYVIEFPYQSEAVENAFTKKMEKLGYRGKEEKGIFNKDKGFVVYKNAYITDISDKRMDYVVEVERKSRKEKDESLLYLIILDDKGENASVGFDAAVVDRIKSFLSSLSPDVEAADLELQIKEQENVVAKSEKKLSDLKKDKDNLEKKLSDNIKDQENTQKDIDSQKQALDTLRLKRKS